MNINQMYDDLDKELSLEFEKAVKGMKVKKKRLMESESPYRE